MKITHNKVGQNLNMKDSGRTDKADQAKSTNSAGAQGAAGLIANTELDGGAAKVEMSSRAQQMKKAKEVATSIPDVDEAKVARLQKLIDEGKYSVSAKDIADKMVDEELAWS